MKKTITKIFAGLLCVVLCAGMLCGCTTQAANTQSNNSDNTIEVSETQFEKITTLPGVDINTDAIIPGNSHYFTYYRCKLTNVMYISYRGDYAGRYDNYTGFTVMMKADGTPMLYDEWIELLKSNAAAAQG